VNKFVKFFLLLFFINNCSLDNKTGIWSQTAKIKEEEKIVIKEAFIKEEALEKEFNSEIKVNLIANFKKNSFINNITNNNGRINYNGTLKNISKFKFSKIDNFNQYEPEIAFHMDNVIFFDNKGSILKFDNNSKLIWKKNYYTKSEKKLNPILFFGNNNNILVVADNIAKYYAININNGELLWSKNNIAPFNSQVKIFKDKFFVIDFENILRCFSIINGKEIWQIRTDQSFIKSQKKLSLVIINNNVIFSNSVGDITAVNIESGNLVWQMPTQSSAIYEDAFFLKTSDLIAEGKTILFSNNRNEFFSINASQGQLNWKQKINSNLRSTIVENLIFTVSMEGYLIVTDNKTGNIVRITDIFDQFKQKKSFLPSSKNKKKKKKNKFLPSSKYSNGKTKKKKKKSKWLPSSKYASSEMERVNIKPVGFILGSKNIYLTTDNGKLLIIDIRSGRTSSIIKIDNNKISRPFVLNKNLFIIKDNSIIKLN
tara:strand:+ start:1305 stop:2756 length:1452 start_codon:yes stop_codon:yes gene_type:complete